MQTPKGGTHEAVGKPTCLVAHTLVQNLQGEIHRVSLCSNLGLITAISVQQLNILPKGRRDLIAVSEENLIDVCK